MTVFLFLLFIVLIVSFIVMFVVRHRNRHTFPGFHRHPENLRRGYRKQPVNEDIETTMGFLKVERNFNLQKP